MPQLTSNKATICVVNYKTLDFTRLCLRSIRKFTDYPYEVIVVDNDSNDESTEYLRSLKWIRLIERQRQTESPRGSFDQASALDLGLANCNTEFFVAMHSDVFIKTPSFANATEGRPCWLTELISCFNNDPKIACVGSGKIELTPQWQMLVKKLTDFKALGRKLFGTTTQRERLRYYNRAICCLYRTEVLRHEGLSFIMGKDRRLTVGQKLYFELVDRGYKTVELHPSVMGKYIVHLAHATQVINPQEFKLQTKTHHKFNRLVEKVLSSDVIKNILEDDSLDK